MVPLRPMVFAWLAKVALAAPLCLAQNLVVSSTSDSGAGSLRQALADAAAAPGDAHITFDGSLSGQLLTLASEIRIADASGTVSVDALALPSAPLISGGPGDNRIFSIAPGSTVVLRGLDLRNGGGIGAVASGQGGAIHSEGALTVTECKFYDNTSTGTGGALAHAGGTLTAERSLFLFNRTQGEGGGVYQAQTAGAARLERCTLVDNLALRGGAIACQSAMTVDHCTVTRNVGSATGRGIHIVAPGALTVTNSLVAENVQAAFQVDIRNEGSLTRAGANLIQWVSEAAGAVSSGPAAINQPPNLESLKLNGGRTETFLPAQGSPAIDASVGSTSTADQRGSPMLGVADLGAAELSVAPLLPAGGSEFPRQGSPLTWNGPAGGLFQVMVLPAGGAWTPLGAPTGATSLLPPAPLLPATMHTWRVDLVASNGTFQSHLRTFHTPLYVTSTLDSGAGSLRDALQQAATLAGPTTIRFSPALEGQTIQLAAELVAADTSAPVTLDALDVSPAISVNGGGKRILHVAAGVTVTVSGLSLVNGYGVGTVGPNLGGAVYNQGTLSLTKCGLIGNQAQSGGAIHSVGALTAEECSFVSNAATSGAGVYGSGTFRKCTFTLNMATQKGGGLFNALGPSVLEACGFINNRGQFSGAGLYVESGEVEAGRCTFSANASFGISGAIHNLSTLNLRHCTITANTSASGGGAVQNEGTTSVENCVIAGNSNALNPQGEDVTTSGTLLRSGANLLRHVAVTAGTASGPAALTDAPGLSSLGTFGGPFATHVPLPGSPAIHAAVGSASLTDARGAPVWGGADLGAVEALVIGISPPAGATGIAPNPVFSWTGPTNAEYRVFLGTTATNLVALGDFAPGQSLPHPSGLALNTAHHWRVDTRFNGLTFPGLVNSFSTIPSLITNSLPAPNAIGLPPFPTFSWSGPEGASYQVLLGTSAETVAPVSGISTSTVFQSTAPLNLDTPYYWRVDTTLEGVTSPGQALSFRTVDRLVTGMTPADGAASVAVSPSLAWQGPAGAEFQVLLGASVNTLAAEAGFSPSTSLPIGRILPLSTPHYWRVDTRVNGIVFPGPLQTFSTTSTLLAGLTPANGATGVHVLPTLSWSGPAGAEYQVLLGASPSALAPLGAMDPSSSRVITNGLDLAATHYWRVDTRLEGNTLAGEVLSFTTQTQLLGTQTPANGAVEIGPNPRLTWSPVPGALHQVMLGASPGSLGARGAPTADGFLVVTPSLDSLTTYAWRVDTHVGGRVYPGVERSFTTGLIVSTLADSGPGSLREALASAATLAGTNTIRFKGELSGGTLVLSSEYAVSDATGGVTVDAIPLPAGLTLDAGPGSNRHFYTLSGSPLTLMGLTLTGGNGDGGNAAGYGGSIYNQAPLTLDRCDFRQNTAASRGGAVYGTSPISASNTRFVGNACTGGGGGAVYGGGTFSDCSFTGNTTASGFLGGGGIYVSSASSFFRNTFDGNTATANGGAIHAVSSITLNLCTLDGNAAAAYGGGIYGGGNFNITQCTITGNQAQRGGGFHTTGSATLTRSILAYNVATTDPDSSDVASSGSLTRVGSNILRFFANQGGTESGPAALAVNPLLAPLGDYGGSTFTRVPYPGSPAIDAGQGGAFITDQRGVLKNGDSDLGSAEALHTTISPALGTVGVPLFPTLSWNGPSGALHEIRFGTHPGQLQSLFPPSPDVSLSGGAALAPDTAYYWQVASTVNGKTYASPRFAFATFSDLLVRTTADAGPTSLRALVDFAAFRPQSTTIGFDPALSGQTFRLGGEIPVDSELGSLVIDGGTLAQPPVISGGASGPRVLSVDWASDLTLAHLTVTGGRGLGAVDSGNGGAIHNRGRLRVLSSTVSASSAGASGHGGGIYNQGVLTLENTTLSGNSAPTAYVGLGGGVYSEREITLRRCALEGNAGFRGGGLYCQGNATLDHCTLHGNTADDGTAIYGSYATLTATHCTLAGNPGLFGSSNTCYQYNGSSRLDHCILSNLGVFGSHTLYQQGGTHTRSGVNFIGSTQLASGATASGPAALTTNPLLGPLGFYGGPTKTLPLLPGSPAREAAVGSSGEVDQRGFPVVGVADAGAYEAGSTGDYNAWIWETLPASASTGARLASANYDGDGMTNFEEWTALTNPGSAVSVLEVGSAHRDAGGFHFTIQSAPGRTYFLQRSDALGPAAVWTDTGAGLPGNGGVLTFTVETPAPFHRIRVAAE